jgi:hypothetical protein
MGPIAASNSISCSRSKSPRWYIEGVSRDDVDLGHFPPELYGLYVEISEAGSIDADFWTLGLETNACRRNAQGRI